MGIVDSFELKLPMAGSSSSERGVKTKLSKSLTGMKFMKRRQTDEEKLYENEKRLDKIQAESQNIEYFVFDHGINEKDIIDGEKYEAEPFYQRVSFGNFNPEIEFMMSLKYNKKEDQIKPEKKVKLDMDLVDKYIC